MTTADLFNIIVYIKDELQIFFHMPKQSGTFKKKKTLFIITKFPCGKSICEIVLHLNFSVCLMTILNSLNYLS